MAAWQEADKAHKRSAKARDLDVAIAGDRVDGTAMCVGSPQGQGRT
jgi:hypothetical protein